ncbi:MAG: hypothetical protein PUB21_03105 [Bacteroidales bacterium]|nr:hypothetical protein [Bacteroidales bacterium]
MQRLQELNLPNVRPKYLCTTAFAFYETEATSEKGRVALNRIRTGSSYRQ